MSQEHLKDFEPFWQEWYIEEEVETGNFSDILKVKKEDANGTVIHKAMKVIEIPKVQATASSSNLGERRQALHGYFGELAKVVEEEIQALHVLNGKPNILSYDAYEVLERNELVGYDVVLLTPMHRSFISYISGKELKDNREIIQMAKDICHALSELHRMDFLHKDLKLENIYMDEDKNYYLGEIGLENKISIFQTGSVKRGSYEYLAPEVYLNKEYSRRADIYSLGVILYILCNDGKIPKELQRRDKNVELPVPCKAKERLVEIIFKSMAYEMKERYESAESMLEELETLTEEDMEFPVIEEIEDTSSEKEEIEIENMVIDTFDETQEKLEDALWEDEPVKPDEFEDNSLEDTMSRSEHDLDNVYNDDNDEITTGSYNTNSEIISGNGLDITERIIFGNHCFGVTEESLLINIPEELPSAYLEELEVEDGTNETIEESKLIKKDFSLKKQCMEEAAEAENNIIEKAENSNLERKADFEEDTYLDTTQKIDFISMESLEENENTNRTVDFEKNEYLNEIVEETVVNNRENSVYMEMVQAAENNSYDTQGNNTHSYSNMNPDEILQNVEQQYYDEFATKTFGSTINLAMQAAQVEREQEQKAEVSQNDNNQSEQEYIEGEQPVILKPATPKPEEGEVVLKPASSNYSQNQMMSFTVPMDSKKGVKEHTAVKKQGDFWKNTPAVGTYVEDMQEPIEIPIKAMPKKKKKTGVFLAILFILILVVVVIKLLYSNGAIPIQGKERTSNITKKSFTASTNIIIDNEEIHYNEKEIL